MVAWVWLYFLRFPYGLLPLGLHARACNPFCGTCCCCGCGRCACGNRPGKAWLRFHTVKADCGAFRKRNFLAELIDVRYYQLSANSHFHILSKMNGREPSPATDRNAPVKNSSVDPFINPVQYDTTIRKHTTRTPLASILKYTDPP